MNLLLLKPNEVENHMALVRDPRRIQHIQKVLKKSVGNVMDVGLLGGKKGQGQIMSLQKNEIAFEIKLDREPPAKLPIRVILALPRPKVFLRTLFHMTTLGVEEIYFINAFKVEKPYWSAEQLKENKIQEVIELALEQSEDTIPPQLHFKKLFKPFIEDELPSFTSGRLNLVADLSAETPCPVNHGGPMTLALGPEGGWIPYEIEKFLQLGFQSVSLGPRTLRVDTVLCSTLGRIQRLL